MHKQLKQNNLIGQTEKKVCSKICRAGHRADDESGELDVSVKHMLTPLWNI